MIVLAVFFNKQELHDDIVAKINKRFNGQVCSQIRLVFDFGLDGECSFHIDKMLSCFRPVTVDDGATLVKFNAHVASP